MGAEEYGFGTIAMIAEAALWPGFATQITAPWCRYSKEELRKRFTGMPEHVVNFFYFVAESALSSETRLSLVVGSDWSRRFVEGARQCNAD